MRHEARRVYLCERLYALGEHEEHGEPGRQEAQHELPADTARVRQAGAQLQHLCTETRPALIVIENT